MGTPGQPCRRWCRRSRENFVSTTMLARLEWPAYRLSDQTGMAQSVVNCLLRLAKWPKWRSTLTRAPLRHLQSNHLQKKNTTTSFLTLFPFGAIGIPRSSWAERGSQFLIGFAIGFGSTMGFILSISCAFSTIHWDCRTDTYGTHGNSSQTTLLNTSFVRRQLGDCPCQTKASRGGYRHLD